jgi:hypothetical protein
MSKNNVISIIAIVIIVLAAYRIMNNDHHVDNGSVEAMPAASTEAVMPTVGAQAAQPVLLPTQTPPPYFEGKNGDSNLPVMTLEECSAAAVQRQMSSSYGLAVGGCLLIKPDGTGVEKIGEAAQ